MDEILVKFNADTAELDAKLKTSQGNFKKTEQVATDSAKKMGDELGKAAKKAELLKEQLRQVELGLKNATDPEEIVKLTKAQADLNSEIKKTETVSVSLKSQLRSLKEQISRTSDPKELERLAKAAGEISDKINDTNESIKVFSTGSKLEQVGNAFGSIVTNVRNLDFDRASEQAKVLLGIMRSLTFAEAVAGVKSLATAFLDLGKALLLNPVTAFAAAIAAVVYVVYDMVNAFEAFNKTSQTLNESLKASEDRIVALGDKQAEYLVKLAQAQGKLTKSQADAKLNELKNFQERTELTRKFSEDVKKLAEELGLSLSEMRNGKFGDDITDYSGDYKKLANQKKFNLEFAKLQQQFRQEQSFLLKTQVTEQAIANEETNKRIQDQVKANNDKIKQLNDEAIEEQNRLNKVLRDLRTANIGNDYDRERAALLNKLADDVEAYRNNYAILIELKIQYHNAKLKIDQAERTAEQKHIDELNAIAIKASQDRINAIQKQEDDFEQEARDRNQRILEDGVASMQKESDAQLKIQQDLANSISSIIGTLTQIYTNFNNEKIEQVRASSDQELSKLKKQYDSQLISKADYERKVSEIDAEARAKEAELKREAFEMQKNAALIEATISVAQGVATALTGDPYTVAARVALAAAIGAAQIALIASQPTPKFEKGGRIDGKRHSQGGTLIEAEEGEWIIRRDNAIKNDRLLRAVNDGQAQQYIRINYIAPALREQQRKFEKSAGAISTPSMKGLNDKNLLESLRLSRSNDREIAKLIIKELKSSRNYNARNF